MNVRELPVVIQLASGPTAGVVHLPDSSRGTGIVCLTGQGQTRVGPHRQNVLLARGWSAAGFPVLRFDYGGNGDSSGSILPDDRTADDVRRGIDALAAAVPGIKGIVLWGVCGAGPATVLYAIGDARIRGVMVGNPPLAKLELVRLRRGIVQRLLPRVPAFARPVPQAVSRVLARALWMLESAPAEPAERGILKRIAMRAVQGLGTTLIRFSENDGTPMRVLGNHLLRTSRRDKFITALRKFSGWSLILLSDNDDGALAFINIVLGTQHLNAQLTRCRMTCHPVRVGGHTFAPTVAREEVARTTLRWLLTLPETDSRAPVRDGRMLQPLA